jgi:DivIVA domain-containing protein
MVLAFVLCGVALAAVLVAVYLDEPVADSGPSGPVWDLLPTPSEVARVEFPMSYPGYDPASVDLHLDAVARVYADLLALTPGEIQQRAARRVAERTGRPPPQAAGPGTAATVTAAAAVNPAVQAGDDGEALRAEAGLANLRSAEPPAH